MFAAKYYEFKTQQVELHKQAAEYRLVKSLQKPNNWTSMILFAVGKFLITSGQQLVNHYQPA